MKIQKLNESMRPSQATLDDCLQDYLNNAFGYDGVEDYVDTQYPMHPQEFKAEVVNYIKERKNESLSEDIQHCWFGYYLDIKGNKKYFYMTKDSTSKDPDEASDIMEDSIPEPFTKFVFQGSVANTQAEKQGWKLVESKENKAKTVGDFPEDTEAGDWLKALLLNADLELENPRILDHYIGKDFADFTLDINGDINRYRIHKGGNVTIKESLDEPTYIGSSIDSLNNFSKGLGDACKNLKDGDSCTFKGYDVELNDGEYNVYLVESKESEESELITQYINNGEFDKLEKVHNGTNVVWKLKDNNLKESIEVETIGDYITDHYDFDDIDDKYSCINSIKDSFKDEKTISKEELEQFIGAHNGKDKVNESKYQDISNVDLDNELVKDLVARAFDYNQAQWLVDNDIEYAKHLAYDDVSEEEIAKAEQHLSSKGYAHQIEENLTESTIKHIYYHEDPSGLKRGQWLDIKEENGRTFAKWSFNDNWYDITDKIEELPYHRFHNAEKAKTFTFGGWRYWLDDEVEKFWDIEGNRISGDFDIPGMPNVKRVTEGINDLRNEKGQVMADKWYARMYPDDEVGIEQLNGITLDDALKDRSILGHCDTQVRERVYAQLDKYIPLSKESPMYKEVNEDYSDLNKGEWVEYNLSVRKGTENIIPVKVDNDLGNEFYGWAWGEGYHKYQKSRIVNKIDMDDIDEIIRKYSLNEASYGGAFDIEDDQYFTRDDIEDAAEYVIDHINETFDDRFVLGGTWLENNTWTVNVQTEDGMEEYEKSIHIDMRKIKAPRDLKDKFNIDMAARLIKDIKELKYDIHEDFEDDITETFIADGEEYEWIDKRITRHDTKDSQGFAEEWFIASAKSLEDGETYYFIIDDNDFIDWGPCYTFDEAQEFLIAKDSDYDDMNESLKESVTSDAEPIENGPKVGMASIISDLIKDEYEAIDGYNAAIATAEAEGFEDAIKVLTEIQAEENIHIGQLQEVMKLFDPNADKVEDGQAEGAEQLANPIATNIDEELETEDSVFNKFVEIEKDLNDGEAVTAVIDRMVADNKDNPTYEKAYQRWLNK